MFIIVFGVVILKTQISVSDPQFPRHIDLQEVGEAIFNNEKFNILKPTAHFVTDHFKDFMLKQEKSHPGDRVFIDKNGFRHAWSDFGDKTRSLRKTDLKSKLKQISGSFENVSEKVTESGIISIDGNDSTASVEGDNENENDNQEEENNASGNNETVQNLTEEDTKPPDSKETTTIMNLPLDAHEMNSTEINIHQRTSDKNKYRNVIKIVGGRKGHSKAKGATTAKPKDNTTAKIKGQEPRARPKAAKPNDIKPIGKERTVATTTFFCPFFGVIKMSTFID